MKLSELNKSVKIIDSTQQRAPRVIQDTETGSTAHVFTHDQDVDRLEEVRTTYSMSTNPAHRCTSTHSVVVCRSGVGKYSCS